MSLSIPGSGAEVPSQGDPLLASLRRLAATPAGQKLLERGHRFWGTRTLEELRKHFRAGETSRTDAVLTRHFIPETGEERREREVTIHVRVAQPDEDRTLDIAHEMIHATQAPLWDPYDPKLTPGQYLWASLEGPGGEIEAVEAECAVGHALKGLPRVRDRCSEYWASGTVSRASVARDFYRVGHWFSEVSRRLGKESSRFPLLNPEAPRLYSSTGHAPYPVALIAEFDEITAIACENTSRRVSASSSRKPASSDPSPHREFLRRRCRGR